MISERLATLPRVVVADHDESGAGQRAAVATGAPYWLSEEVGLDFNDWHRKHGVFKASQAMRGLLQRLPLKVCQLWQT